MHKTAVRTEEAPELAKQALLRRRKALLARDSERNYELSPGGHESPDPAEREEENEAAATLGLLTLEEQRELFDIEAALRRISRGKWGICEACGHAIGRQLLRAMPERRLCLGCEPR